MQLDPCHYFLSFRLENLGVISTFLREMGDRFLVVYGCQVGTVSCDLCVDMAFVIVTDFSTEKMKRLKK